MLKKISAALIVASLFAAPAMAAGMTKTDAAPITKSVKQAKVHKAKVHKAKMHKVSQRHTFKKHAAVHAIKPVSKPKG